MPTLIVPEGLPYLIVFLVLAAVYLGLLENLVYPLACGAWVTAGLLVLLGTPRITPGRSRCSSGCERGDVRAAADERAATPRGQSPR